MAVSRAKTMAKANRINQLVMNESSPEKAGVGGSIPSLATNPTVLNELAFKSFTAECSPENLKVIQRSLLMVRTHAKMS